MQRNHTGQFCNIIAKLSAYIYLFFSGEPKTAKKSFFCSRKNGCIIGFEAKLTGMPASDTAKGFKFLKEYYGENSLIREFVICRVKKEFSIGKGTKAINGIQFDLMS